MEFNKIVRGAKRESNTTESVYAILDAGFLCHVAAVVDHQTMILPTAYGRVEDVLYLHGSSKNRMLHALLNKQMTCISVTHVDGLVLARTLFDSSVNYRSVVLTGQAVEVTDRSEKEMALRVISENIIPGRTAEVPLGSDTQIDVTMVIKVRIETASAKIREGDPMGDEKETEHAVWSGVIPLHLHAFEPIQDMKFQQPLEPSSSILNYLKKHKLK
jgi:nitroimidazol reductase NimA-like FMN-containing flavoprotein (pyridoxamine 5'-phosphate oxidase superfamily)